MNPETKKLIYILLLAFVVILYIVSKIIGTRIYRILRERYQLTYIYRYGRVWSLLMGWAPLSTEALKVISKDQELKKLMGLNRVLYLGLIILGVGLLLSKYV